MPELPEVETIRRDLIDKILNKKIELAKVIKDSAVKDDKERFENILTNNKFSDLQRHGKLLNFELSSPNHEILSHLRMTGKFIFDQSGEGVDDFPGKHTGVVCKFEDGAELYFDDIRTFGYMQLVTPEQREEILSAKLGIEPLTDEFTLDNFKKVLKNRRTNIKNILMKQRAVAGIGNIYADEICFSSGVRPDRKIPELEEREVKKIFESCEEILQDAIFERGTSFKNYVDVSGDGGKFAKKLKVYNREEESCYSCNNPIKKIKLNGRGTHFCVSCQK